MRISVYKTRHYAFIHHFVDQDDIVFDFFSFFSGYFGIWRVFGCKCVRVCVCACDCWVCMTIYCKIFIHSFIHPFMSFMRDREGAVQRAKWQQNRIQETKLYEHLSIWAVIGSQALSHKVQHISGNVHPLLSGHLLIVNGCYRQQSNKNSLLFQFHSLCIRIQFVLPLSSAKIHKFVSRYRFNQFCKPCIHSQDLYQTKRT